MKTPTIALLLALMTGSPCLIHAQASGVNWSALDAGFAFASSGNTKIMSVVGQNFSGNASTANDGVRSGFLVYPFRPALSTGIQANGTGDKPTTYELNQNYPNPFNPTTTIRYALPRRSHVTLTVFNTLGQRVATLVNGEVEPGYHEVQFNAAGLASGVYFYQIKTGDLIQTKRLVLLR